MDSIFSIPRWTELPELDLYMDQVIGLLEKKLTIFMSADEKPMTASMINNYVKQKVIPAPEKKKYDRYRLAQIFVVAVLKKVLSIGEIREVLILMGDENTFPHTYDIFCGEIETLVNKSISSKDTSYTSNEIIKKCASACALKFELSNEISKQSVSNILLHD